MFFVDLDPGPDNKKIYDIRHINHAVVKIEPPRQTKEIPQCHRCQQYGHTRTYCSKPFTCVKCGLGHPTAECKKSIEDPPRCVHCLNTHTANYKGCQVYQALRQKLSLVNRNHNRQNFSMNYNDFPQYSKANNNTNNNNNVNNNNNNTNNFAHNNKYSEVLKQNTSNENNSMKNIENMFGQLMNMLTLLINKLCN